VIVILSVSWFAYILNNLCSFVLTSRRKMFRGRHWERPKHKAISLWTAAEWGGNISFWERGSGEDLQNPEWPGDKSMGAGSELHLNWRPLNKAGQRKKKQTWNKKEGVLYSSCKPVDFFCLGMLLMQRCGRKLGKYFRYPLRVLKWAIAGGSPGERFLDLSLLLSDCLFVADVRDRTLS